MSILGFFRTVNFDFSLNKLKCYKAQNDFSIKHHIYCEKERVFVVHMKVKFNISLAQ